MKKIPREAGGSGRVDMGKMAWAVDWNTVMIVGSAPNFPNGAIDDLK